MRNIWNWIEDNAGPVMVTIAVLGGFAAIIQFGVVRPMHQGFNAVNQRFDDQIKYINQRLSDQDRSMNQRFDAQDRRLEDLVKDVSEFRKLSDRVTRSETRIDALTEQLQTVDAPSP